MAAEIGISQQVYNNFINGSTRKVPGLVVEYYTSKIVTKSGKENLVNKDLGTYTEQRRNLKNLELNESVPVYGGNTNLSNITVYDDDDDKNEIIATLPANMFPGSNYAEKAKGDSMYPIIMNQAWLVGKKSTSMGITYGEKYIIKTKHGLDTTKYIHPVIDENKKRVDGKFLLVAHNKSVPSQEIDIDDITFACRVLWIINPT